MNVRTLLAVSLVVVSAGCAGSRQQDLLREQLDATSIRKPLAETWPEALRWVRDRGYGLVGKDRALVGQDEQASWVTLLSKGHETRKWGGQWTSETGTNNRGLRYRIVGAETGQASCRIEFYVLDPGDPFRRGQIDAEESEARDLALEASFIEEVDPETAAKLKR